MSNDCFHCGLPVPKSASYSVEINNKNEPMCCIGCQSVAQAIVDNNLTDFYNHRTQNTSKPTELIPEQLKVYDNEALQKSFVTHAKNDQDGGQGSVREASLILEGIVCAACVWLNERHVIQLAGVIAFRVNYSTHRATLKWDNEQIQLSDVLKAIADIGYLAHPFDPGRMETLHKKEKSAALRRIALAGIGMMQVMMPAIAIYTGETSDMSASMRNFLHWISLIITTPVVFYSASPFFTSAWRDLKRGVFGMDVPVSLAIGSAYLASVWATITQTGAIYFDSVVMFTFFLLIGRFLEMGARHKAGQVADALVRLLPETATRIEADGQHSHIPANELAINDRVLIKPGEIIPADGNVIEGISSINESLLTGESIPLTKERGDRLIGGTTNIESPLTMRVDKLGDSTTLSSIIRLLDRAQSEKPDLAKFADKSAGWFVLLLLGIALAVFVYWWFKEPSQAFWVALSVLVITCPCALSLATPAALTAATGNLTEKGVLTTRGHALETLAKINHVIFDKTGTLTHGRLKVTHIKLLGSVSKKECEAIAAGLEKASEHPFAKAIMRRSKNPADVTQLISKTGKGVEGLYHNKPYRIGTRDYVACLVNKDDLNKDALNKDTLNKDNLNKDDVNKNTNKNDDKALPKTTFMAESSSLTSTIYLGVEGEWLSIFSLEDEIREEAKQAIKQLQAMNIKVSLLSGDTQQAVNAVAENLKIDLNNAKGELLPADKLEKVQALQSQNEIIAMVGDGVNDAPVLAVANVSVAMGKGSQLAQASADMVLLSENLSQLPYAIKLSKRMQSVIHQNFSWAILYNIIAIPIAAMGWVTPWMAAIGMSMSSLIVVLNALRLK